VTGGVEEGESFEEAALREVLEETGIVATPQKLTALSSFEFDGKWGRAFEQAFGLEVPARLVGKRVELDAREHTDYAWVEADKALEKTHFESNRKILSELILKTNK
jgi:8-oxo-dGTP pyrophosphatase MutT (NUDIX family)